MKKYLTFIRFSHTIFAMPFAMIGFFAAVWNHGYSFSWMKLWLVIGCMVFARSAAMAFNRLADLKVDSLNRRTASRELPAGIISKPAATMFVIACCTAFVFCTWFLNPLCFYLSPVALLVVLGYSYTKRFTHLSHFFLGLGLSLSPIGAYLAVTGRFEWLPVLFGICVLLWVSGFDIIYSLQDVEFDRRHRLFSVPVWLGKERALILSSVLHALSLCCLIVTGWINGFGTWYWTGTFIFMALLIYQHLLVKADDLSRVNMAFFTMNGIASVIFSLFVLIDFY